MQARSPSTDKATEETWALGCVLKSMHGELLSWTGSVALFCVNQRWVEHTTQLSCALVQWLPPVKGYVPEARPIQESENFYSMSC